MKTKIFLSIAILAGLLSINTPVANAAFGASPPWVKNDHLLPGAAFEETITFSRSDTAADMKANIRMDLDNEIKKWISIENADKLIVKKGEKTLPMKVTVKVPKNAAQKEYKGSIFVTLESAQDKTSGKGGSVAIKLGAHIAVQLKVINTKVIDYKVKSISLDQLSEKEIFYLNIEVENTGNTPITKVEGQADIYSKKDNKRIHSLSFGSLKDSVPPDSSATTRIDFNNVKLDQGEYWVDVKVLKDNKSIYENRLNQTVGYLLVSTSAPKYGSLPDLLTAAVTNSKSKDKNTLTSTNSPTVSSSKNVQTAPAPQNTGRGFVFVILILMIFGLGWVTGVCVVKARKEQQSATAQYFIQKNLHKE